MPIWQSYIYSKHRAETSDLDYSSKHQPWISTSHFELKPCKNTWLANHVTPWDRKSLLKSNSKSQIKEPCSYQSIIFAFNVEFARPQYQYQSSTDLILNHHTSAQIVCDHEFWHGSWTGQISYIEPAAAKTSWYIFFGMRLLCCGIDLSKRLQFNQCEYDPGSQPLF